MYAKLLFSCVVAILVGCCFRAGAEEWSLKPAVGDVASGWKKEGANWTFELKNPLSDQGALWTLFTQNKESPRPDEDFSPMVGSIAFNYYNVWASEDMKARKCIAAYYKDFTLTSVPRKDTGMGAAVGISFQPGRKGTYAVQVSGTARVQAPSCGFAVVEIYAIDLQTKMVSHIEDYSLNNKSGYGGYPDTFAWEGTVELAKESALVVRIMPSNPGPASCGYATLTFTKFDVKTATP